MQRFRPQMAGPKPIEKRMAVTRSSCFLFSAFSLVSAHWPLSGPSPLSRGSLFWPFQLAKTICCVDSEGGNKQGTRLRLRKIEQSLPYKDCQKCFSHSDQLQLSIYSGGPWMTMTKIGMLGKYAREFSYSWTSCLRY